MNLALQSIYRVIDDATERMPRLVRETCFVCGGKGATETRTLQGVAIEYCLACASRGYYLREA